jgi:hypothetical protein
LEHLKTAMTAEKRRKAHKSLDISRSTLENTIWRNYKPVAHLWASHVYYVLILRPDDALAFPCRVDQLPDFLALADFFALSGLSAKMPRRKKSEHLLDESNMWRIPSGLHLPRYEMEWGDRPRLF